MTKVLVFEDVERDQAQFRTTLEGAGCSVRLINHAFPEREREAIVDFAPDLAIVDSRFQTDIDGADIIRFLHVTLPDVPIVVCSMLFDDHTKRQSIYSHYKNAPGVRSLFPKSPFPTAEEILACRTVS